MTLLTYVKLSFLILIVLVRVSASAVTGVFIRPKGWSWSRNVKYELLRSASRRRVLRLIGSLHEGPPVTTVDVYKTYCKLQNTSPKTIALDAGAWGCWIGPAPSKKVLLYFHGGGYTQTAHVKHIEMLGELVKTARAEGKDFSVFAVAYGLLTHTPIVQYPVPLIQAAFALKYLISHADCQPGNIFVAGDSAGGHLALALLSHLAHPHPEAPTIDLHGQKLGGLYVISPWVTFAEGSPSWKANMDKDYLTVASLKDASELFLNGAKVDEYNVALSAAPEWWQDFQAKDVCILGGGYEMFLDDIKAFGEKVKVHNPQTEVHIAPYELHVESVVNRALGLDVASSEKHFTHWIVSRL